MADENKALSEEFKHVDGEPDHDCGSLHRILRFKKSGYPFCAVIETGEGGLGKRSVINCSQIRTIDRKRLITSLGKLSEATMLLVDQALRNSLSV
jgi:mRNA-degrading endonuclease toxin of MazEF toxin-antitoxin module